MERGKEEKTNAFFLTENKKKVSGGTHIDENNPILKCFRSHPSSSSFSEL